MNLIEPLPTPPIDGVPIAAVQHVIDADPPLSFTALGLFMYCASFAWSLEDPRTVEQIMAWRPQDRDEVRPALAELHERGFACTNAADEVLCTTGVPGGDPR